MHFNVQREPAGSWIRPIGRCKRHSRSCINLHTGSKPLQGGAAEALSSQWQLDDCMRVCVCGYLLEGHIYFVRWAPVTRIQTLSSTSRFEKGRDTAKNTRRLERGSECIMIIPENGLAEWRMESKWTPYEWAYRRIGLEPVHKMLYYGCCAGHLHCTAPAQMGLGACGVLL